MLSRIQPSDKHLAPVIELYFNFLKRKTANPKEIAYSYIEESFRKEILSYLTKSKIDVLEAKFSIISSKLLEKR